MNGLGTELLTVVVGAGGSDDCTPKWVNQTRKDSATTKEIDAPVARWGDVQNLIAVIERAAARRS